MTLTIKSIILFAVTFCCLTGMVSCSSSSTDNSTTTTDPIITNSVKTAGSLSVSALTTTYNGSYAPRHVLAIWIESNNGTFVKTLMVNAQARKSYLTNWVSNSSANTVDATTGATLSSHATRTCSWNGTDVKGTVVGDGIYKVCMELTENNATGKVAYFTFTKGTSSQSQTPSAQTVFSNISIQWTPK